MSHLKTQAVILGQVTFAIQRTAAVAEREAQQAAAGRAGGSSDLWFCSHAEPCRAPRGFYPPDHHRSKVTARTGHLAANPEGRGRGRAGKWTQLKARQHSQPPSTRPHVSLFTWYHSTGGKFYKSDFQLSGLDLRSARSGSVFSATATLELVLLPSWSWDWKSDGENKTTTTQQQSLQWINL